MSNLQPCIKWDDLKSIAQQLQDAFIESGRYEDSMPPCHEFLKVGVDFMDTDFDLANIDPDLDLDTINNSRILSGT